MNSNKSHRGCRYRQVTAFIGLALLTGAVTLPEVAGQARQEQSTEARRSSESNSASKKQRTREKQMTYKGRKIVICKKNGDTAELHINGRKIDYIRDEASGRYQTYLLYEDYPSLLALAKAIIDLDIAIPEA
jgi:hypothetical protein